MSLTEFWLCYRSSEPPSLWSLCFRWWRENLRRDSTAEWAGKEGTARWWVPDGRLPVFI